MPPGKENDDWLTIFRSGMWRLFYKLSTEGKIRFYKEFLPLLHDTAHEVLQPWGGEAWYLVYLGTKPGSRGKGYARKLLEWGVKQVSCLLLSTSILFSVFFFRIERFSGPPRPINAID